MRIIMKQVDVIAGFSTEGEPRPYRFKLEHGGKTRVVSVGRINRKEEERLAGNRMIVFHCETLVKNEEVEYILKYEVNTWKWFFTYLGSKG